MTNNLNGSKLISALLLCAMLAGTFCACGDSTQSDEPSVTTDNSEVTTAETTSADTSPRHNLPADLSFDGEAVNIWYFTKNSDASERFIDIQGELDGDVVNEALYYRNIAVEEQLSVDLVFTDTGIASSDVGTNIRTMIMSGSTEYDIFNVVQWNSAKYVTEGLYRNLIDLPYVDIEQPWWSEYYINEINIGHKSRYFLCGDISIDMIRCIGCMYFNKDLYRNYWGEPDEMYQTVLDGQWTIDLLAEYVSDAYVDMNGNDQVDDDDQYGLFLNNYNNIDVLYFGAGCRVTERDDAAVPYLAINNEHTSTFMEKLYSLCYENKGTMLRASVDGDGVVKNNLEFNNGHGMFLMGFLYVSESLRDMEQDYGIIPSPKYDETQENYDAVVHDIATLICLPTTCEKLDVCGAVLELMAYESYTDVTPAYYETAMKTKYTRDQLSSQIIDLLHDSNMTDIAYSYNDNFNGLGLIARTMVQEKKSDLASYYATKESAALKKMQELIEAFENLE